MTLLFQLEKEEEFGQLQLQRQQLRQRSLPQSFRNDVEQGKWQFLLAELQHTKTHDVKNSNLIFNGEWLTCSETTSNVLKVKNAQMNDSFI